MSDDLVKQPALRKWQESVYGKGPWQVPDYESMAAIVQEHERMADRIEELEAQQAKTYQALLKVTKIHDEVEVKLAKAVDALVVIDALDPEGLIDGCSQSALRGLVLRMGATARTTLAELKGEDRG